METKKERGMTRSLYVDSQKNPQRRGFGCCFGVFFPCHAFNGGLFPVCSVLEVAPASVFFNFWPTERCITASGRVVMMSQSGPLARLIHTHKKKQKQGQTPADVALGLTREKDRNSLSSDESWRGHALYSNSLIN